MSIDRELLAEIKRLVGSGRYRVRIHAVRHMIEEGFGEQTCWTPSGGGVKSLSTTRTKAAV